MRQFAATALAAGIVLAAFAPPAFGPASRHMAPGGPVVRSDGEATGVIVRYRSGADRAQIRADARVRRQATLPVAGTEVVEPAAGVAVAEAVRRLERSEDVLYAEPDVPRRAFVEPNDRLFGTQWGLRNVGQVVGGAAGTPGADIAAVAAWERTTGSAAVRVAVIDTGAALEHPDLAANLWRNPGESGAGRESNGRDDDGNGFPDDVHGWDFVEGDAQPVDANGHGTHVAGTAAAVGGDERGVAGVSWRASTMVLRVLGDDGSGSASAAIAAYRYAAEHGARVVNLSLGGASGSRTERDVLAAAPEVLFVAAAGNAGTDNDLLPSYPCAYDLPNVVCVAASDRDDALASFSNFGARSVDVAAPGVAIASTWPNGQYALLDGTSMAAPHVSGIAALALARDPALALADLRTALLAGVDERPGLVGRVATGGRIDARSVLDRLEPEAPPAPAPAPAAAPESVEAAGDQPVGSTLTPPAATTPVAPVDPATAPSTARDSTPPGASVALARRTTLARAVRRGLAVRIRCSERCTARVLARRGSRPASTARTVRLAGAGARTVTLRLSPAARRALRRARRATLVLRARVTDAAGNARTVGRRVTLRR